MSQQSQRFEYFGKYLLLEKLATGGMAEVYLARSTGAVGITKFFAIKRILPQYSESPEFIEMFKDEAKIAINLSHSNVVSIYEFGVEKEQFFLAMDYVEGKNLRQILNKMKKSRANLTIDQIVYVAKEVAAGLDHAHRCLDGATGRPLNITHRDMSPQNIMISFEGEVKIVDFGIAKAESQIEPTKAGTLKGKFGYMSPEQAEGLPVDLRTDIFSLGIVLWELLSGDRLFIANNEINTLRKIRECQVPSLRKINANISPELEKIVNKALAKDRNLRYQTAAALHKDLSRFLNRHYPDFSPHDFSIFCKTLFASEILENRKRLIEYAKVSTTIEIDKTEVTDTLTDSSSYFGTEPDEPRSSSSRSATNLPTPMNPPSAQTVTAKPKRRTLELEAPTVDRSAYRPPSTTTVRRQTNFAQESNDRWREKSNVATTVLNNSFVFFVLLVIGLVGGAIRWFQLDVRSWTKIDWTEQSSIAPTPRPQNPAPAAGASPSAPPPTGQVAETGTGTGTGTGTTYPHHQSAAVQKYTVLITSSPAAAEISINGQNTGVLTPGTIQVEPGKSFTLTLRYDGYINYERSLVANQTSMRVQATLQRARLSYLDINVMPAGSIIFINDQPLSEKPPIRHYAVQAGTNLVIRAQNPLTGAVDEAKVSVEQDKVKKVNLFPKTRGGSGPAR